MSHTVWFEGLLTCLNCGAVSGPKTDLQTAALNHEAVDNHIALGEVIEVTAIDFQDAYLVISAPQGPQVLAIEEWGCPVCDHVQWARIELERLDPRHHKYVSAQSVAMTVEQIQSVHYLSKGLRFWVHGNADPQAVRILEAYGKLIGPLRRTSEA